VELLVIVSILVLLTAIAIPAMRPALEGRRIREAARAVNAYLGSARNRALETGRPCGVMLHRVSTLPQCAMELDQVEVPPPYGGDDINALAKVTIDSIVPGKWAQFTVEINQPLNTNLLRPGDLIQLNYQGPFYTIEFIQPSGTSVRCGKIDLSSGQWLPWTNSPSRPVPFKIFRQPVKSHATPLQLPAGAVIDLEFSGSDNNPGAFYPASPQDNTPVVIMFSPNGAVEGVYVQGNPVRAVSPIYLLIGKRERVRDLVNTPLPGIPAPEDLPNLTDLANLWITINPQTGLVTTTENASVDLSGVDWTRPNTWGLGIDAARAFAKQQSQSMGGR
jgi:hypothetical protein